MSLSNEITPFQKLYSLFKNNLDVRANNGNNSKKIRNIIFKRWDRREKEKTRRSDKKLQKITYTKLPRFIVHVGRNQCIFRSNLRDLLKNIL